MRLGLLQLSRPETIGAELLKTCTVRKSKSQMNQIIELTCYLHKEKAALQKQSTKRKKGLKRGEKSKKIKILMSFVK